MKYFNRIEVNFGKPEGIGGQRTDRPNLHSVSEHIRSYWRPVLWPPVSSKSIKLHLEGIRGQSVSKRFLQSYEVETFDDSSLCRA